MPVKMERRVKARGDGNRNEWKLSGGGGGGGGLGRGRGGREGRGKGGGKVKPDICVWFCHTIWAFQGLCPVIIFVSV